MNVSINSRYLTHFAPAFTTRQIKQQHYAQQLSEALDRLYEYKPLNLSDIETISIKSVAKEANLSPHIIKSNNLITPDLERQIAELSVLYRQRHCLQLLAEFETTISQYNDDAALQKDWLSLRRRYAKVRQKLLDHYLPLKDFQDRVNAVSKTVSKYSKQLTLSNKVTDQKLLSALTSSHEERKKALVAAMQRMRMHQNIRTKVGATINIQSLVQEADITPNVVYKNPAHYTEIFSSYKAIEKERRVWVLETALNKVKNDLPTIAEQGIRSISIALVLRYSCLSLEQFKNLDTPLDNFYKELQETDQLFQAIRNSRKAQKQKPK